MPTAPARVPHETDFDALLYERLRKTPWFLTSLVVHAIAFLVLANVEFSSIPPEEAKRVEATLDAAPPDELVEIKPPEPVPDEIEPERIDDVTVDVPETDDDATEQDNASEDDASSDTVFDASQSNTAIGLGGGLGGPPGRGGGGAFARRFQRPDDELNGPTEAGLDWLARHQVPEDGYWDADGYSEFCDGNLCDGKGYPAYDAGVTGLALLAFLGAGHTHRSGRFKDNVATGIRFLRRIQDPEGCFGVQSGHFMYSHAICTLAMAEAYGMTGSPMLRRPVVKATAFLERAQNPNPSGTGKLAWRYSPQSGENDTSVTGWVVMALKSAQAAGIQVSPSAFEGAAAWLDRMTDDATGRVGYVQPGVSPVRADGRDERWPRAKSEAVTAVAMLSRAFIGSALGDESRHAAAMRRGARLCVERLPRWNENDGSIDHYYWYYGTLALFQVGGNDWRRWNKAMKRAIIDHQCIDGCERGSWPPLGPWGADGGRVYSTALMTMCLEVYYRYPRVFGTR